MVVTKVKYYEYEESRGITFLCKCSVIFDDCVMVHNIKLFNGRDGVYVIMPEKSENRKTFDEDENRLRDDVFHPLKKSFSVYLNSVILDGFDKMKLTGNPVYVPQ